MSETPAPLAQGLQVHRVPRVAAPVEHGLAELRSSADVKLNVITAQCQNETMEIGTSEF